MWSSSVVAWRDEDVVYGLELCGIEVLFVLLPVVIVSASDLAQTLLDRSLDTASQQSSKVSFQSQ